MSGRMQLPAASEGRICNDLVDLTEALSNTGADISSGLLGGEFGYGAYFENDIFMMHPFCWCEGDDCDWCISCDCDDDAWRYFLADGSEVDADAFYDAGGYRTGTTVDVPERQCRACREDRQPAANFLHKSSGTAIRWYKYIGRGMKVDVKGDWRSIFDECVESVSG
jgi:hypothetical protein